MGPDVGYLLAQPQRRWVQIVESPVVNSMWDLVRELELQRPLEMLTQERAGEQTRPQFAAIT